MNLSTDLQEEDFIPPRPVWIRYLRAIIAIVCISGLLFLSGIHQYFFLQKTPETIEQPVLSSKVQGEVIRIPLKVHILTGDSGSDRTDKDADRLVKNSNNIWSQANIEFYIQEINYIKSSSDELIKFESDPHDFIEKSNSYDPRVANVYFTRTLAGVNGLAYGGTTAVSVADYTSALDFRTLAHEFGHLLGLPHVSNNINLMATGGRGTDLSREEINIARENAKRNFVAITEQ